ncbi:MAG TPA: hypothetical protein QF514_03765, partial [Candidatus Thalassarchaeaceae archaeon]|nr:hypothetical protein [Candidatus Thalassarchaeaceae archaeon]
MSDDVWEAEILEDEVYGEWIDEPLESIERREKRQLDVALASTGAIVIAFTIFAAMWGSVGDHMMTATNTNPGSTIDVT